MANLSVSFRERDKRSLLRNKRIREKFRELNTLAKARNYSFLVLVGYIAVIIVTLKLTE